MHFVEVTKDDGTRARIQADAVELVWETQTKGVPQLMVVAKNVTLKCQNETMDSFFCKLEGARGGLKLQIHGDDRVPNELKPPLRYVEEEVVKPAKKTA